MCLNFYNETMKILKEYKAYIIPSLLIVLIVCLFLFLNKKEKIDEKNVNVPSNQDQENSVIENKTDSKDNVLNTTQPSYTSSVDQEKVNELFDQSSLLRLQGKFTESESVLKQAMALDPKNSKLVFAHSTLLNLMGSQSLALTEVNRAIAIYAGDSEYWLWKIELEKIFHPGDTVYIEKVYNDALLKTKNNINIVTGYASYLASIGKKNEAITYWQKAIDLYPKNKDLYQQEIDGLSK